jgi:hypothetical protein
LRRTALTVCCLAGLGTRIWLAHRAPHSTDIDSYREVLDLVRQGRSVYEGTTHYNYPPVWIWVLVALNRGARALGTPFETVLRSFLIVIDLAVATVLAQLAGRLRSATPGAAAALYLANPVVIWVSAAQAQFDNLVVLFLLIALLADRPRPGAEESPSWMSMGSLALSIGLKQITAFHPILWLRGRRWRRALLPWALVAAVFIPYASHARAIRDHVLLYRSVPRSFGFSELVLFDEKWLIPLALAAFAATAWTAWALRTREKCRSSLLLFLVLLVFAPGFGLQYLVWPLALGALFGGPGFWMTTAAGLLWTDVGAPWSRLSGVNQFGGQLLWLSLVFWALREARSTGLFAGDRTGSRL